jgi:hypothetical protein
MSAVVTTTRCIARLVEGMPASDGAGVRLTRILGTPALDLVDPFLMLDEFRNDNPDDYIAGFPPHPHRGFETVTYMLKGRMRHEDSVGNSGLLADGAVQWMTAGRGIIHSEMPEQTDGLLWGYQLWVNLPARLKMSPPRYQDIPAERIPAIVETGRRVKVIAGSWQGASGAAATLTPITYFDVSLDAGAAFDFAAEDGVNAFAYVIEGTLLGSDTVGRELAAPAGRLALFSRRGDVRVRAGERGARFLFLAGKAIEEPVARMGPFVMNTRAELLKAADDYRRGVFDKAG